MIKLTANEKQALQGIYNSDFRDGHDPVGRWVWSWSANTFANPRTFGGVVSSLIRKGLVEQSGPKGGSDNSCLCLTAAGEGARRGDEAPTPPKGPAPVVERRQAKAKKNFKPTAEEARIIRDCAQHSARLGRVEICPSTRYWLDEDRGEHMNVALLTADPHFEGTDLADNSFKWGDFLRGFPLTDDGRATLDFWVYSTGLDAELKTNVTAYWEGGKLARVEGTADGVLWPSPK